MNSSDDTPLSILEECYQSVFSVARFYLQNSIEPSRLLMTTKHSSSSSNDDTNQQLTNDEQHQLVYLSK